MVQAKAKSARENSIRKFMGRLRSPQIYLPWLAQSVRNLHPDSVASALSAMREVRICRQQVRRPERQGARLEVLEQRIYMSALPTPFANMDIGSPVTGGSAIYVSANNQWQATGAGTGITGTADQFNYTAENWTGSGSLTANVGSVANTGTGAQAGVMFRDTSAAGSSFAAVVENANGTISLEYRSTAGSAVTVDTATASAIAPAWVQLSETQSGTTGSLTGYYSTNGTSWTQINSTPVNITLSSSTNLAGLAVTSGNAAQSQSVNFNSFSATPIGLTSQDIGSPGIAGSSTYDPTTGNWTINGGGADIWNASDQFSFASQSFTGDGSIVARVNSQTGANSWAKAGVMFRNDNTAGAAFADMVVTPGEGLAFQWRTSAGGQCGNAQGGNITAPVWVKLTRAGNDFSAFYSPDGTTWTQVGTTQTLQIGATSLAGLAVTAHNNTQVSTATFSNLAVTAATLPAGFTNQDIGNPQYPGSASYDSATGTWTVNGGGSDIWNTSDQFNFTSESFTGDGQIVAQVDSIANTNGWAKAGAMFRNDYTAGAVFADVVATPGEGVTFQWRNIANAISSSAQITGITGPVWVKLTRVGNAFSAYYSTGGSVWIQIGGTQDIAMNSTALAGLAVTAHDNTQLGTATFSSLSIGAAAAPADAVTGLTASANGASEVKLSWTDPNPAGTDSNYIIERSTDGVNFSQIASLAVGTASFTDNALQASTQYYYQVVAANIGGLGTASSAVSATTGAFSGTLPASWNMDQYSSNAQGGTSYSSGVFTVSGAGAIAPNDNPYYYVGATSDAFQYAYQSLGSNGQITAQVTGQANTSDWAQAGVMVRAAGGGDAPFAGIFITPSEGVMFLYRQSQGESAGIQADISYSGPVWLKLTISGGTVTGYASTDGTNWAQIGQAAVALGAAPTVGLASASGTPNTTSAATFANVAVGAYAGVNAIPETAQSIHTEVYSGSDGRITWRPIPGATSITVQQSTDGGSTWSTVSGTGGIPGTADTWLPTGLMPNTTYSYRIQATNSAGSSPWSPVVSLTTSSSTSWGQYQVPIALASTTLQTGNVDTVGITPSGRYAYADSWQQSFLRGASGQDVNQTLGLTYSVGNFAAASSGQGFYGNSYGINLPNISSSPSFNIPPNTVGLNDTAEEYYYNGYQNDGGGTTGQNDTTTSTNPNLPTHSCPDPTCPCPPAQSSGPVNYYDGAPEITSPGLASFGFAGSAGVNLNWTTMTVYTPNSIYGNGWSNSKFNGTYLVDNGGASTLNPDIIVVNDAYNQDVFDYNSSTGLYQVSAMATSTLSHNATNGTYTVTTAAGNSFEYYDFGTTTPTYLQGKLIATATAAGDQADYTYNSSGQLTAVAQTDAAGDSQQFNYTYIASGLNAGKVALVQQFVSGALYRQMASTYYDGSYTGDMQYGNAGDLQSVTIEDAAGNIIDQSIYRYYTPSEISSGAQGFAGGLQYVFNSNASARLREAVAAYNAANGASYDVFSAPATLAAAYADNYFQYNSNHQVTLETFSSGGSSATNGLGTQTFSYYQNPQFVAGDNYNTWFTRTTQTNQDGSRQIVYTNVNGDTLLSMTVDNTDIGNPSLDGKVWITANTYDSQGRQLETISTSAINMNASILNGATTPTAIQAALEQYADLGISEGLVYTGQGLINSTTYYASTTATSTTPGGAAGYTQADYVQQGSAGTPIEQDSYTYIQHLDSNGNTIFPEATFTQYQSTAGNGSTPETTDYSYSWQSNSSGQVTNQIADQTTSNPVVISAQNGSGTATSTKTAYNTFGQVVWTMDARGYITYTAYDNATGAVIQSIQDVNTANLTDLTNYAGTTFTNGYNQYGVPELPSTWATPTGGGLNLVTTSYVDSLGRTIEQVSPAGSITLYVYDDANHAMFTLSGVILNTANNTLTTTGPITMTRSRIAYNYTFGSNSYSGTYDETMTFSVNGAISYSGGTGGQPIIAVLPGFIQGTGTVVGGVAGTQPNNVFNLIGNGTSANPQFTIQSLSRTLYNNAGQDVETDTYQTVDNAIYLATAPGQPYSGSLISNPTATNQTGNYYAGTMAYNIDGNVCRVVDNNGTISDTVYDSLGRVVSDWTGTNDAVSNATGTPSYFNGSNAGTGNNMTEAQSYVYDNGGVGDSNVTEVIQYPDGTANTGTQRVSLLSYDFRDRLVATETGLTLNSSGQVVTSASDPYPIITVSTLDNLGDVPATLNFNGGATSLAAAIVAASSAAPGAVLAGLIGYRTSEYDSQNRAYENQTYSVDPTTGTISNTALTSYSFYGPRGNVIETVAPTGQVTKDVYNGVGELVDVYITDGGAVNNGGSAVLTYAAAGSVSNDVVISQTAYGYDGDGNLIETVHAQRFNTDPILGTSAEGALFTDTVNTDGSLTVTPASNSNSSLSARIYYSATYYDAADREIATVNAGTNPTGTNGAAAPWTRPANAPVSVNDSNFTGDLITLTSYNPAGEVYETTDSKGIVAANFYNSLGETVETIAAYDPSVNGGNPTNDQNQTTLFTYDGIGDQTSMTAEDPSTGNQTTTYIYGVSPATGSTITSDSLLYQTDYPGLTGGPAQRVTNSYSATGDVTQSTDRNGNVHQYTYDTAGREISDTVTTLGASVDGSVRRIDTAYNNQGLAYLLTSYADTAGTQIVNQVENIYNGLGQLAFQYQAVTGAVDVSTTPYVQYTYTSPSNGSRLASMVYPNGRTIDYNYSGANLNSALDNAIGRLDSISDGTNSGDPGQVLEQYSYLGSSTIVARNHPQTGINLTLVGSAGSIGSGGDQYVGLDRFGRIVNQNWKSVSSGQSVDNFTYSYDANSNVTAENNLLNTAYSQAFTYDPLNRLAASTLGGVANQSWNLDSQGNWSSFTSNGTTQAQTANAQNQITSISGSTTPTYDNNGNMTTDQSGNTYIYNAWNQLVAVKNSAGVVIADYTYDARGYRVTEIYPLGGNGVAAGTTNYIYYDTQWQAIETRTNGTANSNVTSQTVWSAAYINAAVLQDAYSAGVIQPNSRIYFLQDANWNTTAVVGLVSGNWQVAQRYVYIPYGTITVLNADWSTPPADTQPMVQNLYQGMTLDSVTGLYYARNRNYDPSLGRWINQDPLQYINGANTYQFVMSNPVGLADPMGKSFWSVVGNFVEGAVVGAAVAAAVVVAAPEIAAAGAAALVVAGVEAATATTVASAAVTAGLAAATSVSVGIAGANVRSDVLAHNWNGLAYTAGNMAGGLAVGAFGGGRAIAEGVSGQPSAVPRSYNPLGDMNQSYDPNFPDGSIGKWISKAPTPQSGAGLTTLIGTGLPHLPSDGSQGTCKW